MPLSDEQRWTVYSDFLATRCFPPGRRPGEADLIEFLRDRLGLPIDDIEAAVARFVDELRDRARIAYVEDHPEDDGWREAG